MELEEDQLRGGAWVGHFVQKCPIPGLDEGHEDVREALPRLISFRNPGDAASSASAA